MNIKLSQLTIADANKMSEYANNIKIWRNVTDDFPHPYSFQDGVNFINFINDQEIQQVFKITRDEEFVGLIGFTPQAGVYRKTIEIGYWIGEPFWGFGVVTKAIAMMVEHIWKNHPDVLKIYAKVYHTNLGSMRVLEKNGFEKEAILKKGAFKDGEVKDLHYYAKFR